MGVALYLGAGAHHENSVDGQGGTGGPITAGIRDAPPLGVCPPSRYVDNYQFVSAAAQYSRPELRMKTARIVAHSAIVAALTSPLFLRLLQLFLLIFSFFFPL